MTTMFEEPFTCSVCGTENNFGVISSTNSFGSPDLDTRPPEMQRSTISFWVQRCSGCGYCASDISEGNTEAASIINGKEYKLLLNNPEYPELATSFLCKALLDRAAENFSAAAWATIHAAWACDDADQPAHAVECRKLAADTIMLAKKHHQPLSEQDGVDTVVLVDLLRRSNQIDPAKWIIMERRDEISEEIITTILDYQLELLEKNDVSCRTINEAMGEGE